MSDELKQTIVGEVATNGWAIVHFMPSSDDPQEMFSYTVGVPKNAPGWPELIVFGLPQDKAREFLANALAECWDRQTPPHAGMSLNKVLLGHSARIEPFTGQAPRYFLYSDWYAEHEKMPAPTAMQLQWPDRDGRFPGEADCAAEAKELQTPKD